MPTVISDPFALNELPQRIVLTPREIAMSQLRGAVLAFARGEWAIAITLAGAAEGRCPADGASLHRVLRFVAKVRPDWLNDKVLNDVANRMKHCSDPRDVSVDQGYVVLMLLRAVTAVEIAYGGTDEAIRSFEEWVFANGITPP